MPRTKLEVSGVCTGAVVDGECVVGTEESLTVKYMGLLRLQVSCELCSGDVCVGMMGSGCGRVRLRVMRVTCLGRPEADPESDV